MNEKTNNDGDKQVRARSPKYPVIGLRDALDKTKKIWDKAARHEVPIQSLADYWGISKSSSALIGFSAALVKFGLLEYVSGAGRDKQVKLTQLAIEALNHPSGSKERESALKKAALAPEIYLEIWDKYQGQLPDNSVIKPYLLIQKNFNTSAVDVFLNNFRESISLANLDSGDISLIRPSAEPTTTQAVGQIYTPVRTSDSAVIRELPIPLEGGQTARIPYPISEDDFQILLETLELWKKRIVRQLQKPSESKENEGRK
jgi:hypothetical protein